MSYVKLSKGFENGSQLTPGSLSKFLSVFLVGLFAFGSSVRFICGTTTHKLIAQHAKAVVKVWLVCAAIATSAGSTQKAGKEPQGLIK